MEHKKRVAIVVITVLSIFLLFNALPLCSSNKELSAKEILSWEKSTRTLLDVVNGKYFVTKFLNPNPESEVREVFGLLCVLHDEEKGMYYEYLESYMYDDAKGATYIFSLPDNAELEDFLHPVLPEDPFEIKKVDEKKSETEPVKPPPAPKRSVPKSKPDASQKTAYV